PGIRWRHPTTTHRRAIMTALSLFAALNIAYLYVHYDVRMTDLSLPWSLLEQWAPNVSDWSETVPSSSSELPTEPPDPSWESHQSWGPTEQLSSGYDRLPYPVENISYLPVASSVASTCRDNLNYLFFVHTAPDHFTHRDILRKFIGDATLMSRYNWSIVFFLGLARDAKTMDMVLEEATHNGDIVIFPYMDTYRNLTYKYVYGMKWTMDNCPSAKYIVKMDDDIVLNLYKLLRYIDQRTESEKPAFHCCVWNGMPVLRHTMSPWYLSEKLYPPNVFPTYCSGSTVIFRSSILRPLYNASFELPFLSVDDALVTGEMARIAGVGHVSLNRYYSFAGDQWKKVVKGEIIFGHIHGERARVRGWKAVVKELLAKRKIVPKVSDTNDVSKSLRTWSLGIPSTAGAVIVRTTTSNGSLAVKQVSRVANNRAADDLTGQPGSDSPTNSISSTTDMRVIRSNALPSS
ncbi:unnamed protein product, partial [Ixodes persulcatus]